MRRAVAATLCLVMAGRWSVAVAAQVTAAPAAVRAKQAGPAAPDKNWHCDKWRYQWLGEEACRDCAVSCPDCHPFLYHRDVGRPGCRCSGGEREADRRRASSGHCERVDHLCGKYGDCE